MPGLEHLGRLLIIAGLSLAAIGLLLFFAPRVSGLKALGQLPGDLVVERGSFTLFLPIVSSIVISVILTLLVNLITRR